MSSALGRCLWSSLWLAICSLPDLNDSGRVQAPPPPSYSGAARIANLAQLQVRDGAGINEGLRDNRQAGVDVVCLLYVEDKLGIF